MAARVYFTPPGDFLPPEDRFMATAKKLPSGSWRIRVFSHYETGPEGKKKPVYESFTCRDPSREIAEDEAEMIRIIFDRYIHTNDSINGVAKYLNSQGFLKKQRQNNTIPGFSTSFVKNVLDNEVYMGKIAYGRRRTEKKIDTRNEMHVVEQDDYPVYEGLHEPIVSEEDWALAREKRRTNAYRRVKIRDTNHAHVLSGILKCPYYGKKLYGNKSRAHFKDNNLPFPFSEAGQRTDESGRYGK